MLRAGQARAGVTLPTEPVREPRLRLTEIAPVPAPACGQSSTPSTTHYSGMLGLHVPRISCFRTYVPLYCRSFNGDPYVFWRKSSGALKMLIENGAATSHMVMRDEGEAR